jgi:hypothetical protein
VPVADFEGVAYRLRRVLCAYLIDPETELRNGVAVVEGDLGTVLKTF